MSVEHPYLLHPVTSEKVYVLPDVPHCLKNVRNALISHDICFGPNQFASWKDFEELWKLESARQLRFHVQLKRQHVELPLGKKMKVKIAAQTLSRTSAAGTDVCIKALSTAISGFLNELFSFIAIRVYHQMGMMRDRALHMAEFFNRVNNIFDLCNGASPYTLDGKASLSRANSAAKLEKLRSAITWIASWRFFSTKVGKQGQESRRHCFPEGWRVAISSMVHLAPMLLAAGFRHVPFRRMTQDHVEVTLFRFHVYETLSTKRFYYCF